ncbi:hypothetical protein ACA910_004750 [Epithemia clementina (nom. ined.)]
MISIKVNILVVWTETGNGFFIGQLYLVESFILDFQKFNCNSGAADQTALMAQASSHYTYHASDGSELLCDFQGGRVGNDFILSDVVLMSVAHRYGNTDLGAAGIEIWLHSHRCNQFCSYSWKTWLGARRLIQPVFSTTTTLEAATAQPSRHVCIRVRPSAMHECIRVRPSSIMFTQDSIKDRFQDGHTLYQASLDIAQQDIGKRDFEIISVTRLPDGRLFALDNRRLAVFRLLEMAGRVGTIKVDVVPYEIGYSEWKHKYTTNTGGATIKIRPGKHYQIGRTLEGTFFPGLDSIRTACPRFKTMPHDQFSVFLANFMDD